MKKRYIILGLKYILSAMSVAFAAQIAVIVADPRFGEHINQIAPVFGVAFAIVWIGGLRYLPAVFLGALLPALYAEDNLLMILSVPFATVVTSALSLRLLKGLEVRMNMGRIRDAFIIVFYGIILCTCFASVIESVFQCRSTGGISWEDFLPLFFTNWLAAAVGSIIITPFILAWADQKGFKLGIRQFFEVIGWLLVLVLFGLVTFQNWAPKDVLFYPIELALFPIMVWSAIRFGLRGASAGVLVLALLAVWALIPVFSGDMNYISQSPVNVWIFLGIISITSICLAAVMTEFKRREIQITENESRLQAFSGALPDIAFVLSRDGQIEDVFAANSNIEHNHRITNSKRVVGKPLSALFDEDICQSFLDTISSALDSNAVRTLEYSLESVDVGLHWFEARVSPMLSDAQRTDRVVWVAYDISSRKSAEAEIQKRDIVLNATAQACNSLLTTVDFGDAIQSAMRGIGTALQVDRSFIFELLGSKDESFHSCQPRFEWLKNDSYRSILKDASLQDVPFEDFFPGWYEQLMEGSIIRVEGSRHDNLRSSVFSESESQSLLVIPMWVEGNLYGFLAIDYCSQDHCWNESEINAVRVLASSISGLILMREREEELRIARDKSDSASLAKGEFLAMMSHEIRTPMNAIIGYTDLMLQTELDKAQIEQASIIKRSGNALLRLINDVLDYSKIESRTLELEFAEFDLEEIMCQALECVLPDAKDKGLHVDYEIEPNVGMTYIGDAHRLRQVLMNLSSNGVKFTSRGSVLLSVGLDTDGSDDTADALHFTVQDTGCGIARDKFDRLFKEFSQVDSSTVRQFGGTGLGLVISQRLIERMGGEIWVESSQGVGSIFQFIIKLPRPEQQSALQDVSIEAEANNSSDLDQLQNEFSKVYPLKLLVCEDDDDNRWVIKELLVSMGYEPDVAYDGDQALEYMQRRTYDVVLMDVRLPGISGIELTKSIRLGAYEECNPQQYIVAVTAYAMNEDRDKCMTAGMNDYLSKPIEVALLKDALMRAYTASST